MKYKNRTNSYGPLYTVRIYTMNTFSWLQLDMVYFSIAYINLRGCSICHFFFASSGSIAFFYFSQQASRLNIASFSRNDRYNMVQHASLLMFACVILQYSSQSWVMCCQSSLYHHPCMSILAIYSVILAQVQHT